MGPLSLITHKLDKNSGIENDVLIKYIDMMFTSCEKAKEIIQQLLSFSRKQESVFEPIDLNISINNVMKICENSFDKSIKLMPAYNDYPAFVSANKTQIEQVLLNLCINGAHAMTIMKDVKDEWGGTLSITLERFLTDNIFLKYHPECAEREYWLVSVKDSGIGISPENISKIFDPFFTTKENGTGLGLSMVYSIIKQHNGFITTYSEKGIGTSFNIYLPLLEKTDVPGHNSTIKNVIYNGHGTILVADDEIVIRNIMKEFLEECGFDVLLAENGQDCVEIYKKKLSSIKAVILDMSMPGMSGRDVYLALKDITPNIKVLLSSGFGKDKRVNDVLSLGVNGFIQKPVVLEKLSEALYRVLYDS
jgi:CheY-like chemotaxis protein